MRPVRSPRTVFIFVALVLVATACGTRLPNSAFVRAGQGVAGGSALGGAAGDIGGTAIDGGATGGTAGTGTGGAAGSAGGATGGPGGATGGPGGSSASGPGGAAAGGAGANQASDVGVTATSIKIGNITGVGGPLGPDAFGTTLHGLQAWVGAVNAKGGVNGRKVNLDSCDDGQDGSQNLSCAQKLAGADKVFAFIDNNSLTTSSSAKYEYQQGVPDLGLPLNNGYYKYPNMFSIYGTPYPRDGKTVGNNGNEYRTTTTYRYFKQQVGVTKAAFFFYQQPASQSQGYAQEGMAKAEGMAVTYESGGHSGENFAAPNWDADVLAMKSNGVDGVFDAVDVNGNQKICSSMDRYGVTVKAKVSTIEVWNQGVGSSAWSKPCRDSVFINSVSVPYNEAGNPAVAQFLKDFGTYSKGSLMAQWALEGYAAGYIFQDGVASMGASPTRKGFIQWLDNIQQGQYNAHGYFTPMSWQAHGPVPTQDCESIVQWQDSASNFVTRSGPNIYTCYTTNTIVSPFTDDGS